MEPDLNSLVKMTLPELQRFVKNLLHSKDKTHIDIGDVIHTAYILLWEKGLEFNFKNMQKPILDAITQYSYNKNPTMTTFLMTEQDKCCKKCGDIKPVDLFYKAKIYPNGLITYQDKCKVCYDLATVKKRKEKIGEERERFLAQKRENWHRRMEVIRNNAELLQVYSNKWKESQRKFQLKTKIA